MSAEAKLLQKGEADEERPLLPDASAQSTKYDALRSQTSQHDFDNAADEGQDNEDENSTDVIDSTNYKSAWLKGWAVFVVHSHTVWEHSSIWKTMLRLMMISCAVGFGFWFFIPNPELLDVSKFAEITAILNVFVALMISFFLSFAIKRWSLAISQYMRLAQAVRNLGLQLQSVGAPPEEVTLVLRYCVLSIIFLTKGLARQHHCNTPDESAKSRSQMFDALEACTGKYTRLDSNEREIMESCADETWQMLIWVGSILGRMAEDGQIPGMASATYGRIMNLAQDQQDAIRGVRVAVTVPVPYSYVHTLAVLVHLTNIMFAVSLGMSLGCASKGIHNYMDFYYGPLPPPVNATLPMSLTVQVEAIFISFMKFSIGPLLYQAFLELGISISSPFSSQDNKLPTQKIIVALTQDLDDSEKLSSSTPHWIRPRFQQSK